jgi:tripartite-type tricarboxylate transporter receptor subunit TctC
VHPSVPARSVKELIGLARARPGALSFGSGGRGTPAHIAGEILKAAEKLDIVHVPYKGGILAVTDLVSGQIEMVFADMVPSVPHIKTGKLRPLAVTSAQRSPALPEVPTLAEAGVPMLVPDTWWALLAPRGTAPGIVQRLNSEIAQIMRQNDIRERYAVLGVNPAHTSPEGVYELVRKEAPVFGAAFKAAGVKPE